MKVQKLAEIIGADFYTGVPDSQLEKLTTDSSGQTETIELDAPPLEYSLDVDNELQPYSEYTLRVEAPGFEPVSIAGAEILSSVTAIQNISLSPLETTDPSEEIFVIPAHTLYGSYPAKIPEDEIKPVNETGEIVLSRVVVVHTFNPSTWEAEAGRFLSSRPAWSTK